LVNLKNYLLKNTQLDSFIDFSGIPVFDNAVVDAAILTFRKKPQFNPQPPERGLLENENKNIVKEYAPELLDKTGHLKYNRELISLAKQNRNNPTKAEKHIWDNILSNQKIGYKFIQQKTILNFILDFYCSELLLGIEIDGEYHEQREYQDSVRSEELEKAKVEEQAANDEVSRDEAIKQAVNA
jgi:very-short-patch-repair endonuclease